MFFKREKPRVVSFSERLDALRAKGYATEVARNGTLVSRNGLGLVLREGPGGQPEIVETGILLGKELALLTDLGYQKIFQTGTGKAVAAQADYLKALHAFVEDTRESLGLTSLYNQGLGSTNERHLYDRVESRDHGVAARPWESKAGKH